MNFKTLRVFERISKNLNYKTVITIECSVEKENYFFIEISDWAKGTKGQQLWKQKGNNSVVEFDKEMLVEFGQFLLECGR